MCVACSKCRGWTRSVFLVSFSCVERVESTLTKFARVASQRTAAPPLHEGSEWALFPHIVRRPPQVMHRSGPEVVSLSLPSCLCQTAHPLRLTSSSVQLFGVSQPCGMKNDPGAANPLRGPAVAAEKSRESRLSTVHGIERLRSCRLVRASS